MYQRVKTIDQRVPRHTTGARILKLNADAGTRPAEKAGAFTKLTFTVSGGVEFVDPRQVCFLKAESNYTRITEVGGRSLLLSRTLKDCARVFPSTFLRIHQSYLVNPRYLLSYRRTEGSLTLEGEHLLPVSRSGRSVMQQFMASHEVARKPASSYASSFRQA